MADAVDTENTSTEAPAVLDATEITRRLITPPGGLRRTDPAMRAILAPHLEGPETSGSGDRAENTQEKKESGWQEKIDRRVLEINQQVRKDEAKVAGLAADLAGELGGKVTLKVNDGHLFTDLQGNVWSVAEEKMRQEESLIVKVDALAKSEEVPKSSALADIVHESAGIRQTVDKLRSNRGEAKTFTDVKTYLEEILKEDNSYRDVVVLQKAKAELERDLQRARWSKGETGELEEELADISKKLKAQKGKVALYDPDARIALEDWSDAEDPLKEELLRMIKQREAELNKTFGLEIPGPITFEERDEAKKRMGEMVKKLEEISAHEKNLKDKPPNGVIIGPHGEVIVTAKKDEEKPKPVEISEPEDEAGAPETLKADESDTAPSAESSKPRFGKAELVPLEDTAIPPPGSDSGGEGGPPDILPPPPGGDGSYPPDRNETLDPLATREALHTEPSVPTEEKAQMERFSHLRQRMDEAAIKYMQAKKNARSWLGNVFGFVNSLTGGQNSDQRLTEARQGYERVRNVYLSEAAAWAAMGSETPEQYQKAMAELVAQELVKEIKNFSEDEVMFNNRSGLYRTLAGIYRNKAVRAGIGLGLNIGIGASIALGALPLTAALVTARVGFGAVGIEGVIHGIQDFGSSQRGLRKEFTEEKVIGLDREQLTRRIASFDEDLMRKLDAGVSKRDQKIKENLENVYQEQIKKLIEAELSKKAVTSEDRDVAADVLIEILKQERSNSGKDQALISARRWGIARWGAALLLSGALTYFTFHGATPSHEPTPPHAGGPVNPGDGGPDFSTIRFDGADSLYSQMGQPDISSSWGFAQQQIAERVFGMSGFDPNDVDQLARFNELWLRDPARFSKMAVNLTDFMRQYNPGLVSGDLVKHAVNINVPANLTAYLNSINL